MKTALKTTAIVLAVLLVLAAAWLVVTGMQKRTDVFITDWTTSESGDSITITTGIGSSMGFARAVRANERDDTLELDFYNAWGGLNSSLGAKSEFTIELPDGCEKVAVRTSDGYRDFLEKNDAGEWVDAK